MTMQSECVCGESLNNNSVRIQFHFTLVLLTQPFLVPGGTTTVSRANNLIFLSSGCPIFTAYLNVTLLWNTII